MEHALCYYMGCKVPKLLNDSMVLHLMKDCQTIHQRAVQYTDWYGLQEVLYDENHPLRDAVIKFAFDNNITLSGENNHVIVLIGYLIFCQTVIIGE